MATSGRMNGSIVDSTNRVYLAWQLSSQSQNGNYSVVNWQVGWHFQSPTTCRGLRSGDGAINGSAVYYAYGTGDNIHQFVSGHSHGDLQTGSGSVTIYHDSDGYADISVSAGMTGWEGLRSTGSDSWSLPRIPKAPDTPSAPSVTPSGNTLAVSWSAPDANGSAITSYTVQRASNSGFSSGVVTYSGLTGTSTDLTGLSYGQTYYVRVKAINAVGESSYSSGTSATTGITVPDAPPQPSVGGITPVQAAVSWSAPSFVGGSALTGYDVQRARDAAFTTDAASFAVGTGASPYTLTGLLPGTDYWVRVRATNAAGSGAWSTSRQFRTLPGVHVGNGSTWVDAIMWAGNGSAWVTAQVKVGNGTDWK